MPTQSNNQLTSSLVTPLNSFVSFQSYTPINTGTPWEPAWACKPVGFKYATLRRRGWNFYCQKLGYKNVPYIPSIHNDIPLPYTVVYQNNSFITCVSKGVSVWPNYSGQPIRCPSVTLPGDAACAVQGGSGYSNLALDSRVRNTTLAKVNGKIMDKKAVTVDWATFIGESRDTRKMMAARMQQVASVANHLSRGRYHKAWKTLFGDRFTEAVLTPAQMATAKHQRRALHSLRREKNTAARLWLEWAYGWGPLLGTIYDAASDLRNAGSKPLRFRVSASTQHQNSYVLQQSASLPILQEQSRTCVWPAERTDYVKHSISLLYEVKDTIISDLNGAGVINPALVAWELTTGSFIVDWFANVGDYLQSQTIGSGIRFISGTETTVRRVMVSASSVRCELKPALEHTWKLEGDVYISSRFERHDVSRVKLSSHPKITLGFQLNPLSVRRAISAAALLSQSISRIFKP